MPKPLKSLIDHFPLFQQEDYDFNFQFPSPVGLKSTYDEELIRRVSAAMLSFFLGNRSMDYVYKRYGKDSKYSISDGTRLDLLIAKEIRNYTRPLREAIVWTSTTRGKRLGEVVSEWTLLRAPFALDFLTSCANRGLYFETIAVGRMILEQVCWAYNVDALDDADRIRRTNSTKCINPVSKIEPNIGRLYGWLSVHVHWEYAAHIKAMDFSGENLGAVFSSRVFKARMLTLTMLLTLMTFRVFLRLKEASLRSALKNSDPPRESVTDAWQSVFGRTSTVPRPELRKLKQLKRGRRILQLATKVERALPQDPDLVQLGKMLRATSA